MTTAAAPTITPLSTERLSLRALTNDDAAFVLALLTDPDWLRFIGDRGVYNLDDARRQITEKYIAAYVRDGVGLMMVERKCDGAAMGMCGLIRRPGLDDVDIGYAFLPAYRGRGYALESARVVLAHGRDTLKLRRIVAITLPVNVASSALLEKLGLIYEKSVRLPNGTEDLSLYGITFAQNVGAD
jgi:ribosomal-protein-alanine N-acetyltransferase